MAVSKTAMRVIERAVKIRIAKGEELEEILKSYPNLSNEQIEELKGKFEN